MRRLRPHREHRLGAKAICVAVAAAWAAGALADNLPTGGVVAAGSATIGTPSAAEMVINQTSQRVVIDWTSFNIANGSSVNFVQPGASAVALNRVGAGAGQSVIDGVLNANGTVMILNPNGVMFGRTASVNVGGLVASTADIDTDAFMRGDNRLVMTGRAGGASVENDGTIKAADGGLVALVAPKVANRGVIQARLGRVALAGASKVTLDLLGDNLVQIAVDGASRAGAALVANSGAIEADGGRIALTAEAASGFLGEVINMTGIARARGISAQGGAIVLDGGGSGVVNVAGTLDASFLQVGGVGGTVKVLGERVALASTAVLSASGDAGGGTLLVGGNWQGRGPEANADSTTIAADATLMADAVTRGDGGTVVVWADGATDFQGIISARGGALGGNGGMVEVSGKGTLGFDGCVDTSAAAGETGMLLLDPLYAVISGAAAGNDGITQTVNAAALVATLNTSNVTVQADVKATVDAAVNAGANTNARNLAILAPTVDLNARITLRSGATLSGNAATANVNGPTASIQNGLDVAGSGGTVNVAAGSYTEAVTVNKALRLVGAPGARIVVPDSAQINAIQVAANNVTVSGMEIAGPATSSYLTYNWGSNVSRGIVVGNGVTGFTLTGNSLHDLRTGILLDGRNTGTVSGNRIENTKSGISVQYTDGTGIAIGGNTEGPIGNEWGINYHLNGWWDGNTLYTNPLAAAPSASWQSTLLATSADNGGWAVQDQAYTSSNRTRVMVATNGSGSAQGSPLTPLNSIQGGVNAVVAGGTVNVGAGTFAESVAVGKGLTLKGAGAGLTIVDPLTGDGIAVSGVIGPAATVVIDGFTFRDAPNAGVSVASDTLLNSITVRNSEFVGNGKFGFTADGSATAGMPGLSNVVLSDDRFVGNGTPYTTAASLGQGDVHFNYYNGNATLRNLRITGNTEHTGIHFRGYHDAVGGAVHDMGTVVLDNVTVDGSFRRPVGSAGTWNPGGPGDAIHLLEYASVAGLSFSGVTLSPSVGHGIFAEGLTSALHLGDTRFAVPDILVTGTGSNPTRSYNIVSGSNSQNNVLTKVDATTATFTGAADGFAVEDRVIHAVDAVGLGLVTWNPGSLYVTPASGSIQRAVNVAAAGDTVNVAAGTYGEDVSVTALRNLLFNGTTLHSLAFSAGAAGSGIGGNATADGAGGFAFAGQTTLLADTTLRTTGANIVFSGDLRNGGGLARKLTLAAGSGSTRGTVSLNTGGTASDALGAFDVTSGSFSLQGTLWVGRYRIDALGNVALSYHSLHATDAGVTNTLVASGDVTGTTVTSGSTQVSAGGDVAANVTAQGDAQVAGRNVTSTISATSVVVEAQGDVQATVTATRTASVSGNTVAATITAPSATVDADAGVQVSLNVGSASIHADGAASVSGSSASIVIDAPSGSVSGSFGQVSNAGAGLISVNGKPQGNATMTANADSSRVLPAESTLVSSGDGGGRPAAARGEDGGRRVAEVGDLSSLPPTGAGGMPVARGTPAEAGGLLDLGMAVELDLGPTASRDGS